MKVLDLFSGIGGFSLGLERAGMETIAFCENDPYARSILKKHWPDIPIHEDIKNLDGKLYRNTIDVVCGGFPCQPFSIAGKQRGKEDDRHLWPEMLRVVKESRPTWFIGENVIGIVSMALDAVLHDLEAEGYTSQTFVIPACAVGGIHRRNRVFIVSHAEHLRRDSSEIEKVNQQTFSNTQEGQNETLQLERVCVQGTLAYPDSQGLQRSQETRNIKSERSNTTKHVTRLRDMDNGSRSIDLPTQPAVCHRDDGFSDRVARLKALGNAVIPQIVETIGRAINEKG